MRNKEDDLDKIDWVILDVLHFDHESIQQIHPLEEYPEISRDEIIDRLYNMFENGYVCFANDETFTIEQIKNEQVNCVCSDFWYGMTEKGCEFWEENAEKYVGEKIDWSNSSLGIFIYTECRGIIYGTSPDTCLNSLREYQERFKNELIVNFDTVNISKVKEFNPSYYKTIENGYKLKFRFIKL